MEQHLLIRKTVLVECTMGRPGFNGRAVEPKLNEPRINMPTPETLGHIKQRLQAVVCFAAEKLIQADDMGMDIQIQAVLLLQFT